MIDELAFLVVAERFIGAGWAEDNGGDLDLQGLNGCRKRCRWIAFGCTVLLAIHIKATYPYRVRISS